MGVTPFDHLVVPALTSEPPFTPDVSRGLGHREGVGSSSASLSGLIGIR